MNFFKLILFISCLTYAPLYSQTLLVGEIHIDDYQGDTPAILIKNLTQKTQTISNDYKFKIVVYEDDILEFTSAQTTERRIRITPEIYEKGEIKVHLNRYIIRLKGTQATGLSGYLNEDIEGVKDDPYKGLKSNLAVKLTPWDVQNLEREMYIKPMNGEINSQIDFIKIFNMIAPLFKKNKHNNEQSIPSKSNEEIKTYLGITFFEEELNIPYLEIDYFLNYALSQHKDSRKANYLDIIKILSENVENYKNRNIR